MGMNKPNVRKIILDEAKVIAALVILIIVLEVMVLVVPALPFFIYLAVTALVNLILIPLLIYEAIILVGRILITRRNRAVSIMGSVVLRIVAPAVFVGIMFMELIPLVLLAVTYVIKGGANIGTLSMLATEIVTGFYVMIVGDLIRTFNSKGSLIIDQTINTLVRNVGLTIILFGGALLPYVSMPFLYAAIAALIVTAVTMVGIYAPLMPISIGINKMRNFFITMMGIAGLLMLFITTPQIGPLLTQYSYYISLVSALTIVIAIAITGYGILTNIKRPVTAGERAAITSVPKPQPSTQQEANKPIDDGTSINIPVAEDDARVYAQPEELPVKPFEEGKTTVIKPTENKEKGDKEP